VAWRIEFTRNADKAMRKLDKGVAARMFDELDEIAKLEDPRSRGKALTGNLAGVWRYRVGDYRILCDINDGRLVILVVDVAHRREVYKRKVKRKSPSKLGGSRGIRDKEIIAWRQTLARRR
jgi:mRNA interferase RelE/StbE